MKTRAMLSTIAGAGLAAAYLTACGDPLVTAEDRGDALFGVHGQAVSTNPQTPADDLEVAVVFLRAMLGTSTNSKLETEVIPGTITGEFPAKFSVKLTQKPSVYPYADDIVYLTLSGEPMDGVFDSRHSPDGVRIGHLVIGPAAEIAALPALIDFGFSFRTMGAALAPYLPTTTITPYQVIYAEGVGTGDVIYPKYTRTGIEPGTGKKIKNGFTLVDARTYFEATIWQECANHLIGEAYETPEYEACATANAPLFNCISGCVSPDPDQILTCHAQCYASYPGMLDGNACVHQVAEPQIAATCGPEKTPHRDQLRILRPEDALSVTLGEDDVKAGMWVLHATGL